jgi:hypothetical protein
MADIFAPDDVSNCKVTCYVAISEMSTQKTLSQLRDRVVKGISPPILTLTFDELRGVVVGTSNPTK